LTTLPRVFLAATLVHSHGLAASDPSILQDLLPEPVYQLEIDENLANRLSIMISGTIIIRRHTSRGCPMQRWELAEGSPDYERSLQC